MQPQLYLLGLIIIASKKGKRNEKEMKIEKKKLQEILEKHKLYREGQPGGERADLSNMDLSYANLNRANLRDANLSNTDLHCANLNHADLSYADLHNSNLRRANLLGANLGFSDLCNTCLQDATLFDANMEYAILRYATFDKADLRRANLYGASLKYSDLQGSDLSNTDLLGADLSRARGLISTCDYMNANFEKTDAGYIVYKSFDRFYSKPDEWTVKPGSIIEENVASCRSVDCGCGINVGTFERVNELCRNYIYKLLIRWEWASGIVVPYNPDGLIRCERAEIIGLAEGSDIEIRKGE